MDDSSLSINFDNLPTKFYHFYLFNYLHLNDIWNFRLVSKKFYRIVKSYEVTSLSFMNYNGKRNYKWLTKIAKLKDLDFSKLDLLNKPSNNFLNLKDLRIFCKTPLSFRLEYLNKFTKLENLRVGIKYLDTNDDLLRLPNLKQFYMKIDVEDECWELTPGLIRMDTPNLQNLELYTNATRQTRHLYIIDNLIKFEHPHSIKFFKFIEHNGQLSLFENLECLELYIFFESELTIINDIPKLVNFKKLRIRFHFGPSITYRKCIDKLKDLFKVKKEDVQIVLEGVKVKELTKFDEYIGKREDFKFQIDNYDDLEANLDFVRHINYNRLISLLPNQPSDLFNKYSNIKGITIESRIEDEHRLINFIKQCKKLYKMDICKSSLSQRFYDLLPSNCSLTCLEILKNKVDLNFEFIMKMPYLYKFKTDQPILIDKNLNLNDLNHLKEFDFKVNGEKIGVTKLGKDKYDVYYKGEYYEGDFDDLVNWSKIIKENV